MADGAKPRSLPDHHYRGRHRTEWPNCSVQSNARAEGAVAGKIAAALRHDNVVAPVLAYVPGRETSSPAHQHIRFPGTILDP